MKTDNTLFDIKDRKAEYEKIVQKYDKLSNGLTALGLDYSFYVNSYFTGDKKIYFYRDNLSYRIKASIFHTKLLLQKYDQIEAVVPKLFSDQQNNDQMHQFIFESEMEINSLFDSIIFHLSSIFDYLSLMIYYVCYPRTPKQKMWSQLLKSARDNNNSFSKKPVSSIIKEIDNTQVIRMNDYRSDLIHRESDSFKSSFSIEAESGKTETLIFASKKLLKCYKNQFDSNSRYTLTYFIFWILNETLDNTAKIINGLKEELENSEYEDENKGVNSFRMIHIDPITKKVSSPSIAFWPSFLNYFKI